MSVSSLSSSPSFEISKAILTESFKDLSTAIEGKTNEVFSTLLFDSYDDKRIEELMFFEALNWIEELVSKLIYHSGAHLNYSNLISKQKPIGARLTSDEYNEFQKKYMSQIKKIQDECRKIIVDPILPEIILYIKENHSKHIHEKSFQFGKMKLSKDGMFHLYYDEHSIYTYYNCDRKHNFSFPIYTYYGYNLKYIHSDISYQPSYHTITEESNTLSSGSISYEPNQEPIPIKKDFLLKRLCQRHALNESLIGTLKKQLKVEDYYYHMKDLYDEDSKLTQEINTKRSHLNSLSSEIQTKKQELDSIETRLIQTHGELDVALRHLKQFEISAEIEHENSFILLTPEQQHLLECQSMHQFYLHNAEQLKIYKFAFDNLREISLKLEQERDEFEKWKISETNKINNEISDKMKELEKTKTKFQEELKHAQDEFDEECAKYEIESTKWNSQQESKFEKYQHKIDTYDTILDERDKLKKDVAKLKSELSSVTKQRDQYKTTVQTLFSEMKEMKENKKEIRKNNKTNRNTSNESSDTRFAYGYGGYEDLQDYSESESDE